MTNAVHHIELWTSALDLSGDSFDWVLSRLGWRGEPNPDWPQGRMWQHDSGVYIVLEASPDLTGVHDRRRAGLNHLALRALAREQLDQLRTQCTSHGWTELFGDLFPHAGGPSHTALFLENAEGFELEIVVD